MIQTHDSGCVHSNGVGVAPRGIASSTIALGLAVAVALVSSATGADAADTTETAWTSSFNDSLWINTGPVSPRNLLLPIPEWQPQCFVGCGPVSAPFVIQRVELLSSDTADVSVNKVADLPGHAMGVSGMVVTERFEPTDFNGDPGSLMDWVVVGERELDSDGTHSWSLLPSDISLDARWLPIDLYRFESSSLSADFAAGGPRGTTPEVSTWVMMLIGFAALSFAGYGNSKKSRLLCSS